MKKTIFLLPALLLLSSLCFCQTTPLNKIELGAEGGGNISSQYAVPRGRSLYTSGIGFSAGFSFQYNFSKLLSLRTGIAFQRMVLHSKYNPRYYDEYWNYIGNSKPYEHIDRLILPVLCRVSFGHRLKFFINAGPYIGLLLQDKYFDYVNENGQQFSFVLHNSEKLSLGVSAGIGLAFAVNRQFAISLEARDNFELSEVKAYFKKQDDNMITAINSVGLLIGVSYCFGQKK